MKIKFNNIRDLSDARYAASVMADFMGFGIGIEDELSASAIQEIIGWCSGPEIILEIADHVETDKITALMNTLPVSGIETTMVGFEKWKNTFDKPGFQWIINTNTEGNYYTHSNALIYRDKHFCHIAPSLNQASSIKNVEPWGISIGCFESVSTGIKDFSQWNDFFEALELL